MENYVIYEDEDQRIEIDGFCHFYIEEMAIPYFQPPAAFFEAGLILIMTKLQLEGYNPKKMSVKYWNKIPIFQPNKFISFSYPFNVFENGQAFISTTDFSSGKREINQKLLNQSYLYLNENERFIGEIFKEKMYGVQGYFIFVQDQNVIVLFWGYEDKVKEEEVN